MKAMYPQLENSATLQDSVCQMQLLKRILIHVDVCVTGQFSISFVSLSPNSWIIRDRRLQELCSVRCDVHLMRGCILRDPGADSGGEGKSKWVGKYGMKKSKEQREEPLGTMSYQTTSKWSPLSWLLIGARKLLCISAQSEARTAAIVWNWSVNTLSPGALLAILYFSLCHIFPPV